MLRVKHRTRSHKSNSISGSSPAQRRATLSSTASSSTNEDDLHGAHLCSLLYLCHEALKGREVAGS